MDNKISKIATAHDISGYGRCSTAVILPIISALGSQVCPLPTAILSNHPMFDNFYYYDFTEHLTEYYNNWEANNISFDCLYSGFLGSEHQIEIIMNILKKMKNKNPDILTVIDPVMGDHGKIYKTYTRSMVNKMKLLISKADIATPNLTELCLLINKPYPTEKLDLETFKDYLKQLSLLGTKSTILTGIEDTTNTSYNLYYNKQNDEFQSIPYENTNTKYPGTGDLFTALVIGYIFKELTIPQAIEKASSFVTKATKITKEAKTDIKNGVLFESIMKELF